MRSSKPMPGNPWPHDMSITIDDRPNSLLELLWIREAYELHPAGEDLPPLLIDTPPVVGEVSLNAGARDEWEHAWADVWSAAAAHAGRDIDPRLFEAISGTANGSTERMDILRQIVGPNWRDDVGDEVFADGSYSEWSQRGMAAHLAEMPTALEDSPERRELDALIAAWRAGLTKIVTIPCSGVFTRKVAPNALLTTNAIRNNSNDYRRALSTFA